VQLAAAKETSMDTNTLLIILIILVVFGGGGFYGRGRSW
jgi:LPXTG-motif cell wall-anchored protein